MSDFNSWKPIFSCISVPLQVHLFLIPVMQVETFPVQTMKALQILLGKLTRTHTTSNEIRQPGTSQLKSSPKNQGIQQVINGTQDSPGSSRPTRAIMNNLGNDGKEEKEKDYFNPITLHQAETAKLVSYSKMLANASETKHNKEGRPGKNDFHLIEQMGHVPISKLSTNSLNEDKANDRNSV